MSQLVEEAKALAFLLVQQGGSLPPAELHRVAVGEGLELSPQAFKRRVSLAVAAGVVFRDGGRLVASPAMPDLPSPAAVSPPASGRAESLQSSTARAAGHVLERSRRYDA
jgi:hypothetical protein